MRKWKKKQLQIYYQNVSAYVGLILAGSVFQAVKTALKEKELVDSANVGVSIVRRSLLIRRVCGMFNIS